MEVIALEKIGEPAVAQAIADWLDRSGLVIYPTDTLYGIGGNFLDPEVHDAIDRIKGRDSMPYSLCVANFQMMTSLTANLPENIETLFHQLLPGRFTFILDAAPSIPSRLLKGGSTIGIRVPNLPPLLRLIKRTGIPLITTSVNRSGAPPLNNPLDIIKEFSLEPLVLIDAGALPPSRGSTILDLTSTPPLIVREGDDMHILEQFSIKTKTRTN